MMAPKKREIPPIHLGELLEEFLMPLGMNMNQLELALRLPSNRTAQIVDGEHAVSAGTALRLGRYLAPGADFWINLQAHYDLERARGELGAEIERGVTPRA